MAIGSRAGWIGRCARSRSKPRPGRSSPPGGQVPRGLPRGAGFEFLWAFLDKTFGLGYATPAERAWINGGSPTKGFLSHVAVGPFESTFHAGPGPPGRLAVHARPARHRVALIVGVGLRIAAVGGTLMMLLMWAAEWPLDKLTSAGEPSMSTNPIVDYHIIYAFALIALALTFAGNIWGLGKRWAKLPFVQRNRWLI